MEENEKLQEEVTEEAVEEEEIEKLFDVKFNINIDELYNFQLVMGKDQIEKNKKRSKIISVVEIILGFAYLAAILLGKVPNGMFQYVLTLALIVLGGYGYVYYKYMFYRSLRKSVEKQHSKVPYFNTDIVLEIYPNKCVECFEERKTPNYWHKIKGIISTSDAFYIQLDTKQCLLVPKRCAGEELEPFLKKICEDFEKKWFDA